MKSLSKNLKTYINHDKLIHYNHYRHYSLDISISTMTKLYNSLDVYSSFQIHPLCFEAILKEVKK